MSTIDRFTLLNLLGKRLPGTLAFAVDAETPTCADHPLFGEIEAMLAGQSASLPYVRSQEILWATIAPNPEALRRAIEDHRCWLLPSYGWEADPAVVSNAGGAGQLGSLLLQQSPQGYFRWYSRRSDLEIVIARLAMMRAVISRAPARETHLRPTLGVLRRQFALGLATGDYDLALKAVDEIDQRQLDSAPNSLSMRIRLASTFGDDQAIVTHPRLDDLLSTRVPRRVVEIVLRAHHAVFIAEAEAQGDFDSALAAYGAIADRLAGLAGPEFVDADPVIVAMAAYDAAFENDVAQLRALREQFPGDPVAAELSSRFVGDEAQKTDPDLTPPPAIEISPAPNDGAGVDEPALNVEPELVEPLPAESPAPGSWAEVPSVLASGSRKALHGFLDRVALDPDRFEPGDSDFVFEIFTDAEVMADPALAGDADQVLTAVIDGYVSEDRFPRRGRLPLYQALLEIWSSSRAQSTDPIDGHLLLTLAEALLRLDGKFEVAVETAIARWWEERPVRSNLPWLGEALELLTDQSGSQGALVLWYAGAKLIRDDAEALSLTDRHLWRRLGRRLGLDEASTDGSLGGAPPTPDVINDPLLTSGFKKIAIISLAERAAREAAIEIESRTHANVVVVTDHAAGEGTASAATADVILYVWGATKHAVYRAFDKVRDRLEYVQGTGSSSIVRALERRVTRNG